MSNKDPPTAILSGEKLCIVYDVWYGGIRSKIANIHNYKQKHLGDEIQTHKN